MYIDVEYPKDKVNFYRELMRQIGMYTADEDDQTAVLANASAVLKIAFEKANWVGFYLKDGENLRLGPFQGRPAVTVIPYGKGVCGTAWKEDRTLVVEDVECFEGHIACDCNTHSEIAVPIYKDHEFFGIMDMDSVETGYFTDVDAEGLEGVRELLVR